MAHPFRSADLQPTPPNDATAALIRATCELEDALAAVQPHQQRLIEVALQAGVEIGVLEAFIESQGLSHVAFSKLTLRLGKSLQEIERIVGSHTAG